MCDIGLCARQAQWAPTGNVVCAYAYVPKHHAKDLAVQTMNAVGLFTGTGLIIMDPLELNQVTTAQLM